MIPRVVGVLPSFPCRKQYTGNRARDDPTVGRRVWRGAGYAGCGKNYPISIGRGDRQFYCCGQTKNCCLVSKFPVRMLAGWVLSTRQLPRNLERAHRSQFEAGIISWSVDSTYFKLLVVCTLDNDCGLYTLRTDVNTLRTGDADLRFYVTAV